MGQHEYTPDFIATEMLAEIKQSSKRWFRIALALLCAWLITIGVFIWYLYQYDFSGTSETTTTYSTVQNADGLYAIIDSDGNVIASDIPDDQLGEYLDGVGKSSKNDYQNNDSK